MDKNQMQMVTVYVFQKNVKKVLNKILILVNVNAKRKNVIEDKDSLLLIANV